MDGEHGQTFSLKEHANVVCAVSGFPRLRVGSRGRAIDFTVLHGVQYVALGAPPSVGRLRRTQGCIFWVAKYRRDVRILRTAKLRHVAVSGVLIRTALSVTESVSKPGLVRALLAERRSTMGATYGC